MRMLVDNHVPILDQRSNAGTGQVLMGTAGYLYIPN